jgi:4-amino-4-deoxy-L-arabinose transferase-like glycosyltransferase
MVYNDLLGKMFLWLFEVAACLVLFDLGRRLFGLTVAWAALFIFVFTPWTNYNVHVPLVEGGMALFLLAAANGYVRGLPAGQRAWWWIAALYVGIAVGSKQSSLAAVVLLFAFIAWYQRYGDGVPWTRAVVKAAAITAVACLAGAPWYLRNWVYLGNPVWPFLFGGLYTEPHPVAASAAFMKAQANEWDRLVYFVKTFAFSYGEDCFSFFHPALAVFLPITALRARTSRRLAALLIVAIVSLGFNYVLAAWSSRYWFPYYAVVCVGLGAAFVFIARMRWLRAAAWGLLLVTAFATLSYEVLATAQTARYTTRERFEAVCRPPREICARCEQEAGEKSRILAIASTNLYFRRPAALAGFRARWLRLDGLDRPGVLWGRLLDRRIGIILFDREYTEPGEDRNVAALHAAIDGLVRTGKLEEVFTQGPYSIYRVVEG